MPFLTSTVTQVKGALARLFKPNPVIVKEMRARMRGPRAFWLLTGYLTILGLLAYGLFRIVLASIERRMGPGMPPQSAVVGQTLFAGLALMEMTFVCFITPALTAGTISGELERRTYDMLMATPLHPARILAGKTFASLTYANLLILAAIPLSSIIFLFGGVALRDVVQAIGLMVVVTVTYGMIGVFFSALIRRTGWAMVLSYVVVLALTFGTLFVWVVLIAVRNGRMPSLGFLYLNPLTALASAIAAPASPSQPTMWGGGPFIELWYAITREIPGFQALNRPLWQYTMALYAVITVVLYAVTTQLVKPVRRWRFSWRGLVKIFLFLVALNAGLWVVFATDIGSAGWRSVREIVPTPPPVRPAIPPREVVVEVEPEQELKPTPTPTPPPTPTPTLTPKPISVPFEADAYRATAERYLTERLAPAGDVALCETRIFGSRSEQPNEAQLFAWAYCRAYNEVGGDVVPATVVSAPVVLHLREQGDLGWQIDRYVMADADKVPTAVWERIRANPYDEASIEARLTERARELITEEGNP